MSKHKEYKITLISLGQIVDSLHFEPFCHFWTNWKSHITFSYLKILVILKGYDFIIEFIEISSNQDQIPG